MIGLAVVVAVVAYAIAARRDFAAGLLADTSGRAEGAPHLGTPLALAWRLQRNSFVMWASSFLVVGAVVGGLTSSVSGFLDSPQAQDLMRRLGGGGSITDVFLSVEIGMMAVIVSIYGMQAVMRLRAEETGQRADPLLATPVQRIPWALSHITMSLAGSAALLVIVGLSAGLTSAAQVDTPNQVWRVVGAAVVQLPAIAVVIGIGVAAFGLVPRLAFAGWVALVFFVLLGQFGSLFRLDQWLMNLSPYVHTPRIPGGQLDSGPLVWLVGIAAALMVAGLVGFRRRDLD
jgi:ABC-2 type transport system permease protein